MGYQYSACACAPCATSRKGSIAVRAASTAAACALLAATSTAIAQLPGSTASFKFSFNPVGPAAIPTTWAPTPAPAGQLPSELLQIGHGLPTLGAQTIVLSSLGVPDPPIQTRFAFGPFPSFGFAADGVGNGPFGVFFGSGFVFDPAFAGIGSVSKTVTNGQEVLMNTGTVPLPVVAGIIFSNAGFALRSGGFSASALGANFQIKSSPAPATVYTPSLLATASTGAGPFFFGDGGLGPAALPPDFSGNYVFKTPFTYYYFGYRFKSFMVPPGGTLSINASITRIAEGAVAAGSVEPVKGGPLFGNGGSGGEDFYTLPGMPVADSVASASRGIGVLWSNQSSNGDWGTPINWNPNSLPNPQANIIFTTQNVNNPGIVNLNGNRSAGAIVFFNETGQYMLDTAIGMNTLTLAGQGGNGLVENWSDSTPQINCNVNTPNTLTVRTVVDSQRMFFNGDVQAQTLNLTGSGEVRFNRFANMFVLTTNDNGTISFGGPVTFNSAVLDRGGTVNIFGPQTHNPGSIISVVDGTINLFSDAGSVINATTDVQLAGPTSRAGLRTTQHLTKFTITDRSTANMTVAIPGDRGVAPLHLVVGTLTINTDGTLDLNDNDMIVRSTPAATIVGYIANARHGGAWDQGGVTSSAARNAMPRNTTLGALTGAEYHGVHGPTALFDDEQFADNAVIVKYTYYGDTELNGVVNFDDYSRTDAGFNNNRSGWLNGDFDYNGVVDFDDYSLIDLAFNTQSGTLRRAMSFLDGSDRSERGMDTPALQLVEQHLEKFGQPYANSFLAAVPEPAATCIVATLLALPRRRRR